MFTFADIEAITGGGWLVTPPADEATHGIVDDTRVLKPGDVFVALRGTLADGHRFLRQAAQGAAAAVCVEAPPGAEVLADLRSSQCGVLQVADTLVAYHSLAAAHRRTMSHCTVVGLTGSAGKTSVKEMLAAVCRESAPGAVLATEGNTNNHFGVPRNLLRLDERHRYAIIELGTNQPGDIAQLARMVQPDAAVITNIGHAHLEKLGSLEGVAREKADILRSVKADGLAVIPVDGPQTDVLKDAAGARRVVTFGADESADVHVAYHGWNGQRFWVTFTGVGGRTDQVTEVEWRVGGVHQARNAAAACAVAGALGIPADCILRGLGKAELPGMRSRVECRDGILWFNDAYNANPESMSAGLHLFAEIAGGSKFRRRVLVLGDMLELGSYAPKAHREVLREARRAFPDARIVAVGPQMQMAADEGAADAAVADVRAAQAAIEDDLNPGTAVLLKGSRGMALERVMNGADRP